MCLEELYVPETSLAFSQNIFESYPCFGLHVSFEFVHSLEVLGFLELGTIMNKAVSLVFICFHFYIEYICVYIHTRTSCASSVSR